MFDIWCCLCSDYSDRVGALLAAVCLWGSRQQREDYCDGGLLLPQPFGPKDISLSRYVFTDRITLIKNDSSFFFCACSKSKANQVAHAYTCIHWLGFCSMCVGGQMMRSWCISKLSLDLFIIFLLQREAEGEKLWGVPWLRIKQNQMLVPRVVTPVHFEKDMPPSIICSTNLFP